MVAADVYESEHSVTTTVLLFSLIKNEVCQKPAINPRSVHRRASDSLSFFSASNGIIFLSHYSRQRFTGA
jgi:hypothetical protein